MAGSWGTLAVLTQVTVKITPRPRCVATLVLTGLSDRDAAVAMARAVGSTTAISGAAHVPAALAANLPVAAVAAAGNRRDLAARRGLLLLGCSPCQSFGRAIVALWQRCFARRCRDARAVVASARRPALRRRHAAALAYFRPGDAERTSNRGFGAAGRRMVLRLGRRPRLAAAARDRRCPCRSGPCGRGEDGRPRRPRPRGGRHCMPLSPPSHRKPARWPCCRNVSKPPLTRPACSIRAAFSPAARSGAFKKMQTLFSAAQLQDKDFASSESVIRTCVHCGFCTSTCPTYTLLGDERDSPRGRIYMIKDMLENEREPTPQIVKHVDRCLSCLSCMTTCPSGVNYMHLVDHARAYIETKYQRPGIDRFLRLVLAKILPYPNRFRAALQLSALGRPFVSLLRRWPALKPVEAMLALAPTRPLPPVVAPASSPAKGPRRARVALLQGCAEPVLNPDIRAATLRFWRGPASRRSSPKVKSAAAPWCITSAARTNPRILPATTSMPGPGRSKPMAWTPSSSRLQAAAPRSRITVSCCGVIPLMQRRPPVSRPWPVTFPNSLQTSACRQSRRNQP